MIACSSKAFFHPSAVEIAPRFNDMSPFSEWLAMPILVWIVHHMGVFQHIMNQEKYTVQGGNVAAANKKYKKGVVH